MKNSFFSLSNNSVRERIIRVAIGFAIAVCLFVLLAFLKINYDFGIPCVFHELTGLYCPGCGVTRMLESLVKLDLYQSFRYNMLAFLIFPILIVCAADSIYCYIIARSTTIYSKIPYKVLLTVLIVTLAFGVLRNIGAFDFLAPTDI